MYLVSHFPLSLKFLFAVFFFKPHYLWGFAPPRGVQWIWKALRGSLISKMKWWGQQFSWELPLLVIVRTVVFCHISNISFETFCGVEGCSTFIIDYVESEENSATNVFVNTLFLASYVRLSNLHNECCTLHYLRLWYANLEANKITESWHFEKMPECVCVCVRTLEPKHCT